MTQKINREPEALLNDCPLGSSMAERQCIGCLDAWPCNCKQTPSLLSMSPIGLYLTAKKFLNDTKNQSYEMANNAYSQ